jgi:hypothetical protein
MYAFVWFLLLGIGCDREVKHYPLPQDAQKVNGLRYVMVRHGDGPTAMSGGIWGVESRLLSHTERGCEYPCRRYMLYPRFSKQLEPWNAVVRTMKEGEVRRVWLLSPDRDAPVVYDVELASVVRTDRSGEPIVDNR